MSEQDPTLPPRTVPETSENVMVYTYNEEDGHYSEEIAHTLQEIVIGQDEACTAVSGHVLMAEAGVSQPDRPKSVLFFLGPRGTGKSSMAEALAQYMFKTEASNHLKIIRCGEFADSHSVYRLLGAPPGYVGYEDPVEISAEFLSQPNIILFDEIEKADRRLVMLLLSIMEEGKMTLSQPTGLKSSAQHDISFNQSHIIFTSNIGGREIEDAIKHNGGNGSVNKSVRYAAKSALAEHYRDIPEFIDRMDEVVVFKLLEEKDYLKIFQLAVDKQNTYMQEQLLYSPKIQATEAVAQYIISQLDLNEGARQMRHKLKQLVWTPLAHLLLELNVSGKEITIDFQDGAMQFSYVRSDDDTEGPTPKKPINTSKKSLKKVKPVLVSNT